MKDSPRSLTLALVVLGLSCVIVRAADLPSRPNVVIILTDDHGYGDVSAYRPGGDIRTPNIDRLADEGMLFTTMRANCTVCSPTRAALLTGKYADRVGVPGVIRTNPALSWGYLAPGVRTLADHLRDADYHTALVGKWHLGLESPNTPNERGFDFFHGFLGDMMDSYTTHRRHDINYLRRNGATITAEGHATDVFTDWACDYLRGRASEPQPFLLYLAYNAPHFPIEPPAEWLERVRRREPAASEARARNVALVEHLDAGIGRVLRTLEESGLHERTLVIFTADNGGLVRLEQHNGPWRDGKSSHYDGGLRVPFLARWPGVIAGGARSAYAGMTFDVFATVLEAAGVGAPAGMDAVSLLPLLRGAPPPGGERELYFVRREGGATYGGNAYHALIRGEWKLLQNDPYSPLELYHLGSDPLERKNVSANQPEVVRRMKEAMARHIQRGGAVAWQRLQSPP